MKIHISAIPPEGLTVDFDIKSSTINERLLGNVNLHSKKRQAIIAPDYEFLGSSNVNLKLTLEGSTIFAKGQVAGRFKSVCSRCAEETIQELDVPVDLVLKPIVDKDGESLSSAADLTLGFYANEELDCAQSVEDFLVLALPFTVLCKPDCLGLCSNCGINLNQASCKCADVATNSSPFSVLKELKIH